MSAEPPFVLTYAALSAHLGEHLTRSLGWSTLFLARSDVMPRPPTQPTIEIRRRTRLGYVVAQVLPNDSRSVLAPCTGSSAVMYNLALALLKPLGFDLLVSGSHWEVLDAARIGHGPSYGIFVDGLWWHPFSHRSLLLPPVAAAEAAAEKFDKLVTTYCQAVRRMAEAPRGIPYPGMDGCVPCYDIATAVLPPTRGDEPFGATHMADHLLSETVEPCLVWRALREAGLDPVRCWAESMKQPRSVARDVFYLLHRRRRLIISRLAFLEAHHARPPAPPSVPPLGRTAGVLGTLVEGHRDAG